MLALLAMGFYFMRRNKTTDDFFVSGRSMSSWHIGLSVVATDVGGGFSIGLGGLGFAMGLSGSWMLFTGLIGAWLSAVILVPVVYNLGIKHRFSTLPQLLHHFFSPRVALIAASISALGYFGFTGSQILAGAKLASSSLNGLPMQQALWVMGLVTILYTVMGGMTAVIYTDTVQWIVLVLGLIFVAIPMSFIALGGWEGIEPALPSGFLTLNNLRWQDLVNWALTIIPIWFIGMTLYQRIYASRSRKSAQKAWFIAGLFEWPVMAFMGVILGVFSRVAAEQGMFAGEGFLGPPQMDPESGLPLLLKSILPIGLMGVMLSVYFSAILSTADSCLMAASGNVITDIVLHFFPQLKNHKQLMNLTRAVTLCLGLLAIVLASYVDNVLTLMMQSYEFMVAGLLVPIVAALFTPYVRSEAAWASMIAGGGITLVFYLAELPLPWHLKPIMWAILGSALTYICVYYFTVTQNKPIQ